MKILVHVYERNSHAIWRLILVCAVFAFLAFGYWRYRQPSGESGSLKESENPLRRGFVVSAPVIEKVLATPLPDARMLLPISPRNDNALEKWKMIAKETGMSLVGPTSLRVSKSAVALMELSPDEERHLNEAITGFVARLQAEELSRAYISVDKNGNEQIVVPPFDRKPLIESLRTDLSSRIGDSVANFVDHLIPFDGAIAAGNWEIRTYIETLKPSGPFNVDAMEFEVFDRSVAVQPKIILGAESSKELRLSTKKAITQPRTLNLRTAHLWGALDKMPRRLDPPVAQSHSLRVPDDNK